MNLLFIFHRSANLTQLNNQNENRYKRVFRSMRFNKKANKLKERKFSVDKVDEEDELSDSSSGGIFQKAKKPNRGFIAQCVRKVLQGSSKTGLELSVPNNIAKDESCKNQVNLEQVPPVSPVLQPDYVQVIIMIYY